jgi:hypothetical protein
MDRRKALGGNLVSHAETIWPQRRATARSTALGEERLVAQGAFQIPAVLEGRTMPLALLSPRLGVRQEHPEVATADRAVVSLGIQKIR